MPCDVDYMMESVLEFSSECEEFEMRLAELRLSPEISQKLNLIRIANDQLMSLERAFIHPEGLPGRPYFK